MVEQGVAISMKVMEENRMTSVFFLFSSSPDSLVYTPHIGYRKYLADDRCAMR